MSKTFKLLLVTFSFVLISSANAAEVLMVTWQGRGLPSEPAFEKKIKELRPDVTIKYIDANRSKSHLAKQLRNYDFSKTDLIYTFGTNGTKIVKQYIKGKKPIVFNIVSTPYLSGIVKSLEKPGENITGARLLVDFKLQLHVLQKVKSIKKLAVWFDPREKQNSSTLKEIQKIATSKEITIFPIRVIPDAASFEKDHARNLKAADKVDAVYVVATSSFVPHAKKLFEKVKPTTLTFGTIGLFARLGTAIAVGPEMSERGEASAELASKILSGVNAGDIPVRRVELKETVLFINNTRKAAVDPKKLESVGVKVKYVDPM